MKKQVKPSTSKVAERYEENLNECMKSLAIIQTKLKDHKAKWNKTNKTSWGYVGDVAYLKDELTVLARFLNN